MTLEELRKDIEKDSRADASKIEKNTEKEVEAVLKDAREKAEHIAGSAKADIEAQEEREKKELEADLDIEGSAMLLSAREEVIEKGMKDVRKAIATELKGSHMKEMLKSAVELFARAVPKEEITVVVAKGEGEMAKGLGLKVQHADVDGFELYSEDRSVMLDGSIGRLLDSYEDTIKSALYGSIFHERRAVVRRAGSTGARAKARKPKARRKK